MSLHSILQNKHVFNPTWVQNVLISRIECKDVLMYRIECKDMLTSRIEFKNTHTHTWVQIAPFDLF